MHFHQIAASCLLTYICCFGFSHDALWMVQSAASVPQETHPFTFMLQNYDANLLLTQGPHW